MPGEDIQSWSTTAATNATADTSINWAEGQPRASVNNSARSMMAAHAKKRNLENGSITTTGSANAQAFASGIPYTTVPTGLVVRLKLGFTNTAAATLNTDSIGAVAIKDQAGLDIGPNALVTGRYADLLYNGTNWILLAAGASGAAFDAMAYSGMQINGSMEVSQERGATPTSTTNTYICDGWRLFRVGTMAVNAAAGTLPLGFIPGFPYNLAVAITTAQASIGVTDYLYVDQPIEGWRVARLCWGTAAALPITIGFWSSHHRTGVYTGTIRGAAGGRSYAFAYTHAAADVPQYNTVTIPGDTSGTWPIDNTAGMYISFAIAVGANLTAPLVNTWTVGNYLAAPGQINGCAATSDVFRITGVVVLPGSDAPSAARSALIMRPYPQELVLCKRYFYTGCPAVNGIMYNTNIAARVRGSHPVPMRASPSLVLTAAVSVNVGGGTGITSTSFNTISGNYSTTDALEFDATTSVFVTAGAPVNVTSASTGIAVDARL